MRTCPKCGSYVPDGKLFCVSCNYPVMGVKESTTLTAQNERQQTHARIQKAIGQTELDGFFRRDNKNPYHGNTYEQHRSHDPNSADYYKPKYQTSSARSTPVENILCLFAYMGFFFFLPLVMFPNSKFARYHAIQGLILFLFEILITAVIACADIMFYGGLSMLSVFPPLLMICGISNAVRGEMKPLPVIGQLERFIGNDAPIGANRWGR